MDVILSVIAYIFQIACTCLFAVVIWLLIVGPFLLLKVKISKRALIIFLVVIFVVLCAVLAYVCENPIVICPDEYSDVVTDEQIRNVQSIASGIYSPRVPLIPVLVRIEAAQWVETFNSCEIKFRIDYLYYGSIKMVVGGDGIAVVKRLRGL